MLKNAFIPQKIGSFYLFTERVVGIEITSSSVLAAVVSLHGSRRKIEQCIRESIDQDTLVPYQERVGAALQRVIARVSSYTQLVVLVPSSLIVFKEITVPLMGLQKIKMVMPFEIESMLPFSLEQAVVDGIIVGIDTANTQAHMMVAALKRDILQEQLALCKVGHLVPSKLSTDVFDLFGLYLMYAEEAKHERPSLLLNIEATVTRVLLLIQGELVAVRSISRGLCDITQNTLGFFDAAVALDLENTAVQEQFSLFLGKIQVTIEGLTAKYPKPEVLVLCGQVLDSQKITDFVCQALGIECKSFSITELLHKDTVIVKSTLANEYLIPIAAAMQTTVVQDSNLDVDVAEQEDQKIFMQQMIVAIVFVVAIFLGLFINTMVTTSKLQQEITASEEQAVNYVKQQLGMQLPRSKGTKKGTTSLDQMNNAARAAVAKEEAIWFSLSTQNRFSFLAYLQDISVRLNRDALGLDLRQITINEETDTMTLEGRVKNFEALKAFEEALNQSKMFKVISKPQDLTFAIKMILDKSYREA